MRGAFGTAAVWLGAVVTLTGGCGGGGDLSSPTVPDTAIPPALAPLAPSGGTLLRDDGFPSLTGWQRELCCAFLASILQGSRDGSTMLKVEVASTDPLVDGRTRTEILRPALSNWSGHPNGPFGVGDEVWYGFSVYLPTSWTQDQRGSTTQGESIQQIHDTPDPDQNGVIDWTKGRAPILSFQFRGSDWLVVSESGGPYPASPVWREFDLGPVARGAWTDFVVHAIWRNDAQGRLELWRDGTKRADFTGPTTLQNVLPGYFKLGVHKWVWYTAGLAPRVAFYDQLRIADGRGSYALVAPR